jgi:hypothetical protein
MSAHTPLAPFGNEVKIDLKAPLSSGEKEELRRHYMRDGLLVFRELRLSMEE